METAYLKASANGTLPAHARQIMYAARPYIQADAPTATSAAASTSTSPSSFCPTTSRRTGVDWNVVFDARGHFHEPHTEHEVAARHAAGPRVPRRASAATSCPELDFELSEKHFPTFGPQHRFGAILFIEKEGFMPLFEAVKLAERFDLAIMSTKGMCVTASRQLVEELCGQHDIPLLVLHDFDKSGFSIAGTLQRDTRRYTFAQRLRSSSTSGCGWRTSTGSRPRK